MKKIISFALLNLIIITASTAQVKSRGWEKGPLTWSDFSPVNESIGDEHSYLEYILDIEKRNDVINGFEMQTKTAVLYVDRTTSWVDTHYRTPQQLRYNQVAFNIAELHRRKLQLVIDTGGTPNMNYYSKLLSYVVDSFCHETYYGADTAAVAWWEQEIRRQLDSITPIMVEQHQIANTIEKIIPQYWMLFNLGAGSKSFAGDLAKLFAPSGGMYFDFEVGLWRFDLTTGLYIGGGRCRPDSIETVESIDKLYHSDKITTLDLYANLGFTVLDNTKWNITPFVGYGMQGFFYNENDESSNGPTEGCWRAGIDVKYIFSSDETYYGNQLTRFLMGVQGKVYLSKDIFNSIIGAPQGLTINAQLGLSLGMKEYKLRRAVKASAKQ